MFLTFFSHSELLICHELKSCYKTTIYFVKLKTFFSGLQEIFLSFRCTPGTFLNLLLVMKNYINSDLFLLKQLLLIMRLLKSYHKWKSDQICRFQKEKKWSILFFQMNCYPGWTLLLRRFSHKIMGCWAQFKIVFYCLWQSQNLKQ